MHALTDQHINIAGHKVPLALLGVLATIGAALLLMRSQKNANAAAVESQQASGSGVFGGASGADSSGTLQNLQTQLQAFASGLSSLGAPLPAGTPASVISSPAGGSPAVLPIATGLQSALAQTGLGGGSSSQTLASSAAGDPATPPAPPPAPAVSQVTLTLPAKNPVPSWLPKWVPTPPSAKPTSFTTQYVSAPALNQYNPVSDYGRGN